MELLERAAFLEKLDALLARAAGGQGQLVLVAGEAGAGKTALVQAFCRACGTGVRVSLGACDALSTPRPLGPLVDIAQTAGGPLQLALERGEARERLFAAFLDELSAGTGARIVLFEDLHWADDATLDLLRYLGRRIGTTRALLIATYRNDEVGVHHPLRVAMGELATTPLTRLTLPPLSLDAVRTLLAGSALDPVLVHGRTGGNPFFVTELLAAGAGGTPATVRDAVLARLARLPEDGRVALEAAAVIGTRAETWLLQDLAIPTKALEAGVAVGLMQAPDDADSVVFRHDLVREAVLETLSPARRAELHRSVLAALRQRPEAEQLSARLAHHAEGAGDAEAVLAYAPLAAQQAASLKAHREAVAQYQRTLRYADRLVPAARAELLEALAYQYYLTDRHSEAVAAWQEALALRRSLGDRMQEGDILRCLSRSLWYLGQHVEADASVTEALRVLESLPPGVELGWAYSELARLRMTAQQNAEAISWGERAIAIGERLGDTAMLSHALNNVGCARLQNGDERGWAQLERSLDLALADNHEEHAGRAYANLAEGALSQLQLDRAQRYFDAGLAYVLDHDVQTYYFCMLGHRPIQLLRQGRWSEASDVAGQLLAHPDLSPLYRIEGLVALARVRARRGDPEVATVLDEALRLAAPIGGAWPAMVRAARAEAAWLSGDAAGAAAEAQCVYDGTIAKNEHWLVGELALVLKRAGRLDVTPAPAAEPYALQIAGDWRAAAQRWQALGCPYEAAMALADGDEPALREALATFERLGARPAAAIASRRLRALGVRSLPRGPRPATRANAAGLTARELEIWRLLADGLRNAEIARR
ncbi:MAG TPA: AAA family ATPase, partial [Dehalococcoidia bacterium]